MSNYLDSNGLLYFWNKIKTYVTNALANSGFTSNTGTITKVTTSAGVHTTTNVSSGDVAFNVPTKTSHLTNDSGFITTNDIPEGAAASTTTPKMDGTASIGSETAFARGDHRHPSDTTKQDVISDLSTIRSGAAAGATALQSYTETDPVFTASAAHGITSADITAWNSAEANVVKSVNTSAGTSGVNLSLSDAGALDVTISSGSVASGNTNFVTGGTVYSTTSTLAPKASPTFTGTPKAPTAAAGTNTTQIATTAFVTSAIATASAGLASFQGTVDAASTITGADYKSGWYWVVSTAGTYVGQICEAGDMIFAIADKSSAYSASDFSVVQNNMDMQAITNAEIDNIAV